MKENKYCSSLKRHNSSPLLIRSVIAPVFKSWRGCFGKSSFFYLSLLSIRWLFLFIKPHTHCLLSWPKRSKRALVTEEPIPPTRGEQKITTGEHPQGKGSNELGAIQMMLTGTVF
jgi:hypothetical protein